jgi:hypothetical protein
MGLAGVRGEARWEEAQRHEGTKASRWIGINSGEESPAGAATMKWCAKAHPT